MAFIKRIFLFLTVNFLVITVISIIMRIFNIAPYLSEHGLNLTTLLIFCFAWGMIGSLISLFLSKSMAKMMMGVKVISEKTNNASERTLLDMVKKLSEDANIPTPEVGIYNSPEINAFATGASKKSSLVAISSGLLNRMHKDEINAILGHEISHIGNGDMVTMTLLQGIVNAFVMFLARVLAYVISGMGRGNQRSSYGAYFGLVMLFQFVFMILGSLVVSAFSRYREYRADLGGAYLAGKNSMIHALESLQQNQSIRDEKKESPAFQSLKISTPTKSVLRFFATHPPLEKRIERLKSLNIR